MKLISTTLSLLILSACTQKSSLTVTRWNGEGEMPSLSNSYVKTKAEVKSSQEQVQYANQIIEGFSVEEAYVKTVSKDNVAKFQRSVLLSQFSSRLISDAKSLDAKKETIWNSFVKQNPEYAGQKFEQPIFVMIATKPAVKAVVVAEVSNSLGEIFEVQVLKNATLFKKTKMGSGLAEVSEFPTLAFPRGPKKSDLSKVMIKKLMQEGLSNLKVEIKTESQLKIAANQNLEFPTNDERFDQIQAYYYANQILNWFEKTLGFEMLSKLHITTSVGYPDKTNTAFYYKGGIRLGCGDDEVYSKIPWDPSIVMHEVSHNLIDEVSRLPFQGEGGSINEGFADTLTTFYLDNPHLAEVAYKKAAFKRTVDSDLKLADKTGGLYHDSAIVSGFFWQLKSQIGNEKTLQLVMKVLNRLGPNSNFADFALTMNEQVDALYAGEDLLKVKSLMRERGFL